MWTVSSSATWAARSFSATSVAGPVRRRRLLGSSPSSPSRSSNRSGTSNVAPLGKTRSEPLASRTRKPTARSSRKRRDSDRPLSSVTLARYQTHGSDWSGETRVSSAGSIVPLTRFSPSAIALIVDEAMSEIRLARR